MLTCFFEMGPSPLKSIYFLFFVFLFLWLSFFLSLFLSPCVAESASVGQHREAGKVITETGGRLPDSSGNRCVLCFGIGRGGSKGVLARGSQDSGGDE